MKGACGIEVDEDKTFISFACLHKSSNTFVEEIDLGLGSQKKDFPAFLRDNFPAIDEKIKEEERKHSLKVKKIFLTLPYALANQQVVEETIPLKRKKEINFRDLSFARKCLEDMSLDWRDYCLHHFVLQYEVGGEVYQGLPLGVWAGKIKVRSLLVWVRDSLRKEIEKVFLNLDKDLGGLIAEGVSIFSTVFDGTTEEERRAAVKIGYTESRGIVIENRRINYESEYPFGFKKIIQSLGGEYFLPYSVAEEVFTRYISFKEYPRLIKEARDREINIKSRGRYLNLNLNTVTSFVKAYVKDELGLIAKDLRSRAKDPRLVVSFIGRLNRKDGFNSFLRGIISEKAAPYFQRRISSSSGALSYGVSRFLERDQRSKDSFFRRALGVYQEYF